MIYNINIFLTEVCMIKKDIVKEVIHYLWKTADIAVYYEDGNLLITIYENPDNDDIDLCFSGNKQDLIDTANYILLVWYGDSDVRIE